MKISHSSSTISPLDFKDIDKIVENNYVGQGDITKKLEDELSLFTRKRYCKVVNSGSSALLLALLALKQDSSKNQVITSAYVCPAVIHCILHAKLGVVLSDINTTNLNVDVEDIIRKISNDTLTVVVPHMSGIPVDTTLLQEYNIPIIEDCAQAIGSKIRERPVGYNSDILIYSFGSTKMITGGIGGAILSDNKDYHERFVCLSNYEQNPSAYLTSGIEMGYNMNISDVNSSIIISQLKQLDKFIGKRRRIAKCYDNFFKHRNDAFVQKEGADIFLNRYRYYVLMDNAKEICEYLNLRGVDSRTSLAHNMAAYLRIEDCINLTQLHEEVLSLPIHPNINNQQVEYILDALKKSYG